jgi:pimeloyl-ACP methyl ester carboxylesterase
VLAAIAAISVTTVPAGAGQRAPERCEGAELAKESVRERDQVPVLFVHGFLGSPGSFRREVEGRGSMLETVSGVDGVAAYTFDYSEHASEWVTDQAIGPALARAIVCLEAAFEQKVLVVAHSMGGLATRLAQGQVIDGRAVSDSLERVITIGTPARGVLLLEYTNDRLSTRIVQTLINGAGKACDDPPKPSRRRLCELLDAANAPATSAMAPGSGALEALPAWGPDVVVHPMAGDLRLRVSVLGYGVTTSIGDVVATVGSATADASRGQDPLVVRCRTELDELDTVVDRSPCSHSNLVANRRVIAAVRKEVRTAVRALEAERPVA